MLDALYSFYCACEVHTFRACHNDTNLAASAAVIIKNKCATVSIASGIQAVSVV